jgi:hypothetical protein
VVLKLRGSSLCGSQDSLENLSARKDTYTEMRTPKIGIEVLSRPGLSDARTCTVNTVRTVRTYMTGRLDNFKKAMTLAMQK